MVKVCIPEDVLLVVCVADILAEDVPDFEMIEVPDILPEFVDVLDTVLLDVKREL